MPLREVGSDSATSTDFDMAQLGSLPRPDYSLNPTASLAWHQRLEKISFSWRESGPLSESKPVDREASDFLQRSLQATIQSFTELLGNGESPENGYAAIFAKISASLPEKSFVRETLNDALTVSVALNFLRQEAQKIIEGFNRDAREKLVDPLLFAGEKLISTMEFADKFSLDEFDEYVMKPLTAFFSLAENHGEQVLQCARNEARSFVENSTEIIERTSSFVVLPVSNQALTMIVEAVESSRRNVSVKLSEAALHHQKFIEDTSKTLEGMIFVDEMSVHEGGIGSRYSSSF